MYSLRENDVMLRIMMLLPLVAMKRCLPQNVAQPHIISNSVIIGHSPTSLARKGKHHYLEPYLRGGMALNIAPPISRVLS